MIFNKLYRLLMGVVTVVFRGEFAERLLNLCAKNRIAVWDITRGDDSISVKMVAKDFKKLRRVRAKSRIRISLQAKWGLPFVLRKYRKRFGFLCGILLFFIILNFLSSFVWSVEVHGNQKISTEAILAACREIGIEEGMPVKKLDALDQRVEMLLHIDGLAWAALNLEGSYLTVDVTEAAPEPQPVDDSPRNLKASTDGVIKNVEVTAGTAVVKVGEAVRAGDLLVSGAVEYKDGQTELKKADGRILAETERTLRVQVPLRETKTVRTGKVTRKSVIKIFGISLPLYLGSTKGPYEREVETDHLRWFGNNLPIYRTTASFYETAEREQVLSPEEALAQARAMLEAEKNNLNCESIVLEREESKITGEILEAVWHVKCVENIAAPEKIVIHATN